MSEVKNSIPEGWIETTLGEETYFVNDKVLLSKVNTTNYVSTENLLSDRLGKINATSLPSISKVNHYKKGDTLFSNIRTYFKKVWHSNEEGGSSNDVLIFRPKNTLRLDNKFLFFFISSDYFIDFTVKSAKGTKMPRGDKNAMSTFSFNLPPLPEQKAIANVLTAFDDKIENLRAQNDTLEQTAQTIFTEWFGKYQIGDLSADMAGELPEGWRVGTLNELITIIGGGTPKTSEKDYWDGNICWYSVVDAPNNHNCFVVNTEKKITPLGLAKSSTKILRKGTTIISARGTVGKLAITGCDMAMNQSCYGIQGKNLVGDYFIYFQIKQVLNILKNNVHGAVFDTITKSTLEEVPIIIASKKEILEIEIILEALMNKIFHNVLQIQTLSQTRDTILPKLMSGELRVKGFDR